MTPSSTAQTAHWSHLRGLDLADPNFLTPRRVDLVLGAGVYSRVLLEGARRGAQGEPSAQRISLGWVIFGAVEAPPRIHEKSTFVTGQASDDQLRDLLKQFWELEEVWSVHHSPADIECERSFIERHSRDATGRYMVRLPLREDFRLDTDGTLFAARRSLRRTMAKMEKDPEYGKEYWGFMREYEKLGHMREVMNEDIPKECRVSYLPHHGVWQSSDKARKLRVVFDGSLRTPSGTSLNSLLHTGPPLQTELVVVFLRWRLHRYCMVADIEKMYRQVSVDPRDIDMQRILWVDPVTNRERVIQLLTLTYGLACSPYLTLRVLLQLARDEVHRFPKAAKVLEKSTYVDDVFSGGDDIHSTRELRDEIINLLESGGFPLRKWVANHPSLIEDLPNAAKLRPQWKDFGSEQPVKTLGLIWAPSKDEFKFTLPTTLEISRPTKRGVLSVIARLFDPLGWLSPILITPKILMQDMWRCKLGWDDPLSAELETRWAAFATQLKAISSLHLPPMVRHHLEESV